MGFFQRLFEPDPIESAEMYHTRYHVDESLSKTHRKVNVYALGTVMSIWVPGTNLIEVNETMKTWLEVGDDDQDASDDLSSRIVMQEGREVLATFRRSWVSGFIIPLKPGDEY